MANIVTYGYAYFRKVFKGFLQVVGEALCGGAYCVDIHAVGACTHNAAKTTCTEFEVFIERFNQFGLIFCIEHTSHLGLRLGIVAFGKPLLGFLSNLSDEFVVIHVLGQLYKVFIIF